MTSALEDLLSPATCPHFARLSVVVTLETGVVMFMGRLCKSLGDESNRRYGGRGQRKKGRKKAAKLLITYDRWLWFCERLRKHE